MNNILQKILANKTPEEFAAEILQVRKKIGQDNEFDMSVEEALGIDVQPSINFKHTDIKISPVSMGAVYQEAIDNLKPVKLENFENIGISKVSLTDITDTFDKVASYPLVA